MDDFRVSRLMDDFRVSRLMDDFRVSRLMDDFRVFHHMVLIFHSFKDMEDFWARKLPDDFQEVFQTESSPMSPFHNRSERFGKFFRSEFDIHVFRSGSDFGRLMGSLHRSLLKYNALEEATSKKSSRRLPGSLLTDSSSISSGV
ncbi:hypothetical protein F2Q70_00018200 [Brassica cretica]|uniref:Uncharacterized protein n=1 Tax=Brassica cretica TaxID=69181 RepID=A0A8S9I4C3_BRACR|nr:hypothetical protein F2Q70_00018200 [Brassica cretica]